MSCFGGAWASVGPGRPERICFLFWSVFGWGWVRGWAGSPHIETISGFCRFIAKLPSTMFFFPASSVVSLRRGSFAGNPQ